jgi:hypothetical protein
VSYRLRLQGTATLTVMTDEADPSAGARVVSEPWPVPAGAGAYGEFIRVSLAFNRSALHHLPCAILQDPANPGQYRLTWLVPGSEQADADWSRELRLFGVLADKAWQTMPRPGQASAARPPAGDEGQQVIYMP